MRSDLSEHYCHVQKGMENHIRVTSTHKLFSNYPKENAHFICNSKDHSNGDILISIDAS
jgi:hypothetical protein